MFGLIKKIFFGECGSDSELQERRLAPERLKEVARAIECDVAVVRARDERLRLEREEKLRKEREERKLVLEDREDADTSDVRYSISRILDDSDSISRILDDSGRWSIVSNLAPDYEKYPPFGIMLARMVKDRCENKASLCYRRAGVSKQTYSRIISQPHSGVNKTIAMRLCIGLKLSFDEAKAFLATAGYAFSDAIYEDRVFSYCLQNAFYNILDVEQMIAEIERIQSRGSVKSQL